MLKAPSSLISPHILITQRYGQPWLIGADNAVFWAIYRERHQKLQTDRPRDVLLVTADPVEAIASILAAFLVPTRLWLSNPTWGQTEWQQLTHQVKPDQIWGQLPPAAAGLLQPLISPAAQGKPNAKPTTQLLIPTGGSSGNLKFARHTWDTLMAAVQGFQQHFQMDRVNAYCVLPMYHVSGLMQALRCWASGGKLMLQPFRALQQQPLDVAVQDAFLSLVPTQLQRLLNQGYGDWLRQFRAILLGGAAPWPSLLDHARQHQLPLAPTYGMTETAAQVATLLPKEFLAGQNSSGRSLPHVTLTIQSPTGARLPPHQVGLITIQSPSLALNYGDDSRGNAFQPGDLGSLDVAGHLTVLGRQGTLINTGGEKVLPEEVEAAIRATGHVADVAVVGVPDSDWGQVVTAIVVPTPAFSLAHLQQHLRDQLSPYKQPKLWLHRDPLPRNAQGKLNRRQLRDWAQQRSAGASPEADGATGGDGDRD